MKAVERVDDLLLLPLYTQGEVARLIGASQSSLQRWARGYTMPGRTPQGPLVTTSRGGKGYTVPFIGMAEAYMVLAFRRAGVSMARIRPTVENLRKEIGLEHALASERLATDGAEILWKIDVEAGFGNDNRLVVIRNHQAAFGEVVSEHLRHIEYRDGFAGRLTVSHFEEVEIMIDPRINFGQPTLAGSGIRVNDILSRIRAGEPVKNVADDYLLSIETVSELLLPTA